jgi:hypothetical protein
MGFGMSVIDLQGGISTWGEIQQLRSILESQLNVPNPKLIIQGITELK